MDDVYFLFEMLMRIVLSAICGVIIGYERRNRYKVAGIKTHLVVCMASALMMLVSKYGFSDAAYFDASRVASQIVTGIGFLGAGIIFKKNQNVHGLTTAAGIWATAGVGMAVGAGMYAIGILTTLLFVAFYFVINAIDRKHMVGIQKGYLIRLDERDAASELLKDLSNENIVAEYSFSTTSKGITIEATIIFANEQQQQEWLETMLSNQHILEIQQY